MEKILRFSSVLMGVLFALSTYAVGVYYPEKEKEVHKKMVSFAIKDVNKVYVSIYDENNKLLHSECVNPFHPLSRDGKIIRKYNLDPLSDGVYDMVVDSKTKIEKYEIVVAGDVAAIMSDPYLEKYKTVAVK